MFLPLLLTVLGLSTTIFAQDSGAVVVVATTVTQFYTAVASTTPLAAEYTNPVDFKTSILNSTNFYRYEHSVGYIYWNETLAEYAQSYSKNCVWEHSHGPYGENLARGYPNVTAAVEAWGDERAQYHFDHDDPTGFTEATGHFTQLVWSATQATGCGWTNCNGTNGLQSVYLVCEYWPAGNIVGENNAYFKQNVSPERSAGDEGFSELNATRGATGGTPTATGGHPPSATVSEASVCAGIDARRLLVTVAVGIAAVLFGLAMS